MRSVLEELRSRRQATSVSLRTSVGDEGRAAHAHALET
jgi:hypothetical protein